VNDPLRQIESADDRLLAIAQILARGVLRLHSHAAISPLEEAEIVPKPSAERLEVGPETRLRVRVG
jgi:hypothetical protein